MIRLAAMIVLSAVWAAPGRAQMVYGPDPTEGTTRVDGSIDWPAADATAALEPGQINPITLMRDAAALLPESERAGDEMGLSAALNIMLLLTVIALAPSVMLMTTCFVRIIVVLGLLRQAMGTQSLPPPQVIVSLALFMTLVVMAPTFDRIRDEAVAPYQRGEITDPGVLWDRAKAPLRDFMFDQIEATGNWSGVYMMLEHRGIDTSEPERLTRADVDMISLIPAYMLSELKVAFLMGFRIYLPFLVIDMVIASLLISMSMMMLPPVLVSLPFKVLLFVLVDGWALVVGSLITSFAQANGVEVSSAGQAAAALAGAGPPWGTGGMLSGWLGLVSGGSA